MNKVFNLLLVILILFVCIVSIQFLMKKSDSNEQAKVEETQAAVSPEQLKINTMNTISQIVLQQFVENIILNIEITPVDKKQNIVLSLQGTEFIDETTLLKDSYNLLKEMQQIDALHEVTLKWFMNVESINTEAFTLTFDTDTVYKMSELSYTDLPSTAKQYIKHENLK